MDTLLQFGSSFSRRKFFLRNPILLEYVWHLVSLHDGRWNWSTNTYSVWKTPTRAYFRSYCNWTHLKGAFLNTQVWFSCLDWRVKNSKIVSLSLAVLPTATPLILFLKRVALSDVFDHIVTILAILFEGNFSNCAPLTQTTSMSNFCLWLYSFEFNNSEYIFELHSSFIVRIRSNGHLIDDGSLLSGRRKLASLHKFWSWKGRSIGRVHWQKIKLKYIYYFVFGFHDKFQSQVLTHTHKAAKPIFPSKRNEPASDSRNKELTNSSKIRWWWIDKQK